MVHLPSGGDFKPILEYYRRYLKDPNSVPMDWAIYFEETQHSNQINEKIAYSETNAQSALDTIKAKYRQYGHLSAKTDPLDRKNVSDHLEIKEAVSAVLNEMEFQKKNGDNAQKLEVETTVEKFKYLYSGSIGPEFHHINDPEIRDWLYTTYESIRDENLDLRDKKYAFYDLIKANEFEKFLRVKYPTKKKFGCEGAETIVPLIQMLLRKASDKNFKEIIIGGMHRGRLNIISNVAKKPNEHIFAELKEKNFFIENKYLTGDVPYHLGHSNTLEFNKNKINVSISPHPSHLLTVAAYTMGKARAKIDRNNKMDNILCIQMHTDAAFSGQGLASELLQLSKLSGYSVNGSIHVIVNNKIGFTTSEEEGRSSHYCTDIAKMIEAPVLHVNGDDLDAIIQSASLAIMYRNKFKSDIFIDLVCYRKYGHNELDEPRFTDPLLYNKIDNKVSSIDLCQEKLQDDFNAKKFRKIITGLYNRDLIRSFEKSQSYNTNKGNWLLKDWKKISFATEVDINKRSTTGINEAKLRELSKLLTKSPDNFHLNPKVSKFLMERSHSVESGENINWSTAETLALAVLLDKGLPVRFSGQDVTRGTFTQRHWAIYDIKNGEEYTALKNLSMGQGRFSLINSPLSEYSTLSFEYGYSLVDPYSLTIWEAQFGDFANGAQTTIDQVISCSEYRWRRMTSLVLLLPHGLEGQGPDHSSCRVERFLSLCANGNMLVVNCSTPANYFHLLLKQLAAPYRKPLIVCSPKSLLRNKQCVSSLKEFSEDTFFRKILVSDADADSKKIYNKIVFCSGKIRYEIEKILRLKNLESKILVVSIEQLYPFPQAEIKHILSQKDAEEYIWCQEEPKNQGPWRYIKEMFEFYFTSEILVKRHGSLTKKIHLSCIARPERAAPDGGNYAIFEKEQMEIISAALG